MEFIHRIQKWQTCPGDFVATIGNFDGVHLGHQHLIQRLKKTAEASQKPSMIITFEPLPIQFFERSRVITRITSLREKIQRFKAMDVDYVLCLKFDSYLQNLSAEAFIEKILIKKLKLAHLIVGENFQFGKNRQGTTHLLAEKATENGFVFEAVKKIKQNHEPISSTRIRLALQQSDFALAERLLGRRYSISGKVAQGQKLGRTLGFPTANISLCRLTPPISGVFAVHVRGIEKTPLCGVANIGRKPTVNGVKNSLEVFIFDFNQSIYHQCIEVIPLKKIRDEKKFPDLASLAQQISKDVAWAREFFHHMLSLGL
jgi:riboflavin kinase/FMN adenylyltransferase